MFEPGPDQILGGPSSNHDALGRRLFGRRLRRLHGFPMPAGSSLRFNRGRFGRRPALRDRSRGRGRSGRRRRGLGCKYERETHGRQNEASKE